MNTIQKNVELRIKRKREDESLDSFVIEELCFTEDILSIPPKRKQRISNDFQLISQFQRLHCETYREPNVTNGQSRGS